MTAQTQRNAPGSAMTREPGASGAEMGWAAARAWLILAAVVGGLLLGILMQGKTVVVIAHRLSTIARMDRIIVMEEGNIVEEGSHTQLLEQNGLYKKLWDMQAGGFLGD